MRKVSLLALVLVACIGHDARSEKAAKFQEGEVKANAEEAAVLWVCPNTELLKLLEIDTDDCRDHVAEVIPVCWHLLDKIVSDYEVNNSDDGKKRFLAITVNFTSCIQSELLTQSVNKKRLSSSN